MSVHGWFSVLILCYAGDLSRVYPASLLMVVGIKPPTALNRIKPV